MTRKQFTHEHIGSILSNMDLVDSRDYNLKIGHQMEQFICPRNEYQWLPSFQKFLLSDRNDSMLEQRKTNRYNTNHRIKEEEEEEEEEEEKEEEEKDRRPKSVCCRVI